MHIVTVATKNEGYFDYLVESCKRNGGELEVLGWGQEWKGFSHRISLMKDYLKRLADDDIVCFVDGYDVIILEPLSKLEKIFKDSGKRIIFARDIDSSTIPLLITFLHMYFGKCKNLSINAGTYIGYVKDLKELYNQVYNKYDLKKYKDDQIILTDICNTNNNVDIDINRQMFLVTNHIDSNKKKIKIENQRLRFDKYYPCILHAPSNFDLTPILQQLGYNITKAKKRATIDYVLKSTIMPYVLKIIAIFVIVSISYYIFRLAKIRHKNNK